MQVFHRVAQTPQFRQGAQDGGGQGGQGLARHRRIGGAEDGMAAQGHALHHPRQGQVRQQPGLDQRRFAGTGIASDQDKAIAGGAAPCQQVAQIVTGADAAEEHGRMFRLERFQAAERAALVPADGRRAGRIAACRLKSAQQQTAQMQGDLFLESGGVGEGMEGGQGRFALRIQEPAVGKRLQRPPLRPLFLQRRVIIQAGHHPGIFAIDQQVRSPVPLAGGKGVFKFPFSAGHRRPATDRPGIV